MTDTTNALIGLHGHLDNQPEDWTARSMLADLYEEMGDIERAKVQRWLVKHHYHPSKCTDRFYWFNANKYNDEEDPDNIPGEILKQLKGASNFRNYYKYWDNRQKAEDALIGHVS